MIGEKWTIFRGQVAKAVLFYLRQATGRALSSLWLAGYVKFFVLSITQKQKDLLAQNSVGGCMVGQGTTDFEHRPMSPKGVVQHPYMWPLFVLLTDQKQKHLLAPNSGNGCMVGERMPDFNGGERITECKRGLDVSKWGVCGHALFSH